MNKKGFTLIELLIVIAIIGILTSLVMAGVAEGKKKAIDNVIRSDVSQLRISAESAYDSLGGKYTDWTQHVSVSANVIAILEDIDKQLGDPAGAPYVAITRESQKQDYCVSAPLVAQAGKYYCVDTTGAFVTVSTPCADEPANGEALRCPAS